MIEEEIWIDQALSDDSGSIREDEDWTPKNRGERESCVVLNCSR